MAEFYGLIKTTALIERDKEKEIEDYKRKQGQPVKPKKALTRNRKR
jgi:hypothetical protein